jgi:methionyl-tRNA formyltransferase
MEMFCYNNNMEKVRTLFCGTSEFAVPILKKLLEVEYIDLVAVVTQPDRPVGRKQIITPTPIKSLVEEENLSLKIFQPESLKLEVANILEDTRPELIIVASYGQFISDVMLEYPKFKCLNIHGSLLPDLRGAVPVQTAILEGYKKTGVTIQIMSKEMDEGDIIGHKIYDIADGETTATLMQHLSNVAVKLLDEILPDWIGNKIIPIKQDNTKATYCYIKDFSKVNAEIDWSKSAVEIERKVRAFFPQPTAYFEVKIKEQELKIKLFKVGLIENLGTNSEIGKVIRINKNLYVKCGDNKYLELIEFQLEGKKRAFAKDYLYLAESPV